MSEQQSPYWVGRSTATAPTLQEVAEKMAEAIREWERAKQERESWKAVLGETPPESLLGNARKANAMLTAALQEYEKFLRSDAMKALDIGPLKYAQTFLNPWTAIPDGYEKEVLSDEEAQKIKEFREKYFHDPRCICPADGHSELCPVHKVNSSPR